MRNGTGFENEIERDNVIEKLENVISELINNPEFFSLVPQIGTNIVCALSHASSVIEVAGLRKRIHNITRIKKIVDYVEIMNG